jgi:hypothetical protein
MKIKKNDKVRLTKPLALTWSKVNPELPIGTELIVWKASRDGKLACSIVNFKIGGISVYPTLDQVEVVPRNCPMPKVGDLFYSSWGYEQTNIDFYQVTTVRNKMVGLTRIVGNSKYDQAMAGHTTPVPNKFTGEEKMHRINFSCDDTPYFQLNSYSSAWPTRADSSHFFSEWH